MLLWYQVSEIVLLRTSHTYPKSFLLPTLLLAWLFGSTHDGCQVELFLVRSPEFGVLTLYVICGSAAVVVRCSLINQFRFCN